MAVTAAEHLGPSSPESPKQLRDAPEGEAAPPDPADGDHGDAAAEEEEELPAITVWPPSQWAREAVIQSLTESLSSPSSLFEKYGPVPLEEAAAVARRIEQEAFAAVSPPAPTPAPADDDGMETLNAYSKEISKRVVEFCQSRRAASSSPSPPAPLESSPAPAAADAAAAPTSEGAPPLEPEGSRA